MPGVRRGIGCDGARHPFPGLDGCRSFGYDRCHQRRPTAARFMISSRNHHRAQASKVSPKGPWSSDQKGRPSVLALFVLSKGLQCLTQT